MTLLQTGFDTNPIHMEPMWRVAYQAPAEDVDRVFEAIAAIVPLVHGKTDHNGYRACGGVEYYRPLAGTPTGAEEDTRQRPGVDEMHLFVPRDPEMLRALIEAIYAVHSYYEPVITVCDVLRRRGKGLDDTENPHRWWNKDGDWKKD